MLLGIHFTGECVGDGESELDLIFRSLKGSHFIESSSSPKNDSLR